MSQHHGVGASFEQCGCTPRVVKVQMGHDDKVNVFGSQPVGVHGFYEQWNSPSSVVIYKRCSVTLNDQVRGSKLRREIVAVNGNYGI
jgi:hypothetical protein